MTNEVDMELVYQDEFVMPWSGDNYLPLERLSAGEIPRLSLRGWTFSISRLVDVHTGSAGTVDDGRVLGSLSCVGGVEIDSLLAPSLQALGESDFNAALESGRLLCLVLGWIVHYET